MKVISFDVGIKNMAYCILEYIDCSNNLQYPLIADWGVLNLCVPIGTPSIPEETYTCTQCLKNKKICGKLAKYTQTKQSVIPIEKPIQEYSCEKHAREHFHWKMPNKEFSVNYLKKQSLEKIKTLREKYISYSPSSVHKIPKKMEMIDELVQHFESCCWKQIVDPSKKPKKTNASTVDLISIGRSLHQMLNQNEHCKNGSITHVIIENQISPIANRMKTLQGMLAQHFISLGIPHIEFVSSGNKLKEFVEVSEGKNAYQKHKKDGIFYCNQIMQNHMQEQSQWHTFFSQYGSKKDDLADCFLQGIWWWKTKIIGKTIFQCVQLKHK